jgi:hypothetical protein
MAIPAAAKIDDFSHGERMRDRVLGSRTAKLMMVKAVVANIRAFNVEIQIRLLSTSESTIAIKSFGPSPTPREWTTAPRNALAAALEAVSWLWCGACAGHCKVACCDTPWIANLRHYHRPPLNARAYFHKLCAFLAAYFFLLSPN